ncbi:Zinc finger protein CONSTANS-LIKE 4 [Linum perenne]
MASKLCDSCKSATANLFCHPDSAFLCVSCDSKIHAANKLSSSQPRVWVCEVCEQASAHVTCKVDAATL